MFLALLASAWIAAPGNETPAFEKVFSVSGEVTRASLMVCAGGFYEAYLDGERIGNRVLDPSPTDYSKRVLSATLPVTIAEGAHSLRLVLGHGWYDQRAVSAWNNHLDRWRSDPCVKAELEIIFADGRIERIGTDRTWRQVATSLVWDDLREGEIIDPGFILPRKGLGEFAEEVDGPKGKVVPMRHPPARIVRTLPPVKTWKVDNGWMFDFGENLTGWARMKFSSSRRGNVVSIRYDERIRPDGSPCVRIERKDVPRRNRMDLWPDNARVIDCYISAVGSTNILAGGEMQQDRFVLTGANDDFYEPRFTYHGFRYVCVRGVSEMPDAVACEIRTDFPIIGSFESSNKDLNDLMAMADRSYRSNFTDGVPTDCPHREKNGWTGDAQIASEFAQYAYENTEAYLKWISDIVDAQREDGALPGIVPSGGWGFGKKGYGPVWDAAIAVIPWNLYVYRDDVRGLELAREALKRNLEYHLANLDVDGLVGYGLGDWITCGHYTDHRFCGSAYLYGMLQIGSLAERMFGNLAQAEAFVKAADKLREDFNRAFYKGDGRYADGYQTQQALPLTFGLCLDGERNAVSNCLVNAVHEADDHIDFGLVGSKHVLRALSEIGRTDLALKMLLQKTSPTMLAWRDVGGGTLWEDWETGFSRNHVMFCDFACWAYQYLAGIRLQPGGTPAVPNPSVRGLWNARIEPVEISDLDWVCASVESPSVGEIHSKTLLAGFINPPISAKPHTWYHLMNGNITKEGITRDFSALAESGIGGVSIIDANVGIPLGDVDFNSEGWFEIVKHAALEARRLGLELCLGNCSGWSSSGGPWIKPELGMKTVVWSETKVMGPTSFSGYLPRTKNDNGFYEDIAVLAFPTPPADIAGRPLRIADHAKKVFSDRHKNDFRFDKLAKTQKAEEGQAVDFQAVVDLSGMMQADGRLTWQVPEGEWTILRFGYICNGRSNHPATAHGKGLEIDKLSSLAAEAHFNNYIARVCGRLGSLAGNVETGLNAVLIDSYEAGCQNWTRGFGVEFEKTMGYPIFRWMPVLAGYVVSSMEDSERFLEDFRRVIADLFAKNYARRYAELCHSRGLQLQIEPYGNCPTDDLQYGFAADVPMSEFWSRAALGNHSVDTRNSRIAGYLAHVWGRRIAAAEAFTGDPAVGGRWLTTPFSIKAQCDRAYANGVNRIVYHRFCHQPWAYDGGLPGMTMGRYGMHFDRTQTWWKHLRPWLEYQSRCQWMLQEGTFCADVLYYCGEEAPNGVGYDSRPLGGYDFDICSIEALEMLRVIDGKIVAPGGVSYSLLALPSRDFMSVRALNAVERLLDDGAHICCQTRPSRTYGKPDSPDLDAEVRLNVEQIWSKGVLECSPEDALRRLGIEPDIIVSKEGERSGAAFIHRRNASADWYFVALNNEKETTFDASFRQTGRIPEIWDAETGRIAEAMSWREENGRTLVSLTSPPSGSSFVVFRRDGKPPEKMPDIEESASITVNGPWQVEFPVGWYFGTDEVKVVEMPSLVDWTTFVDTDIKYFSGTATYKCKIENVQFKKRERVFLDLGDVNHFAVVTANGRKYPVLWHPPFRIDITDLFCVGNCALDLSVEITNLWPNRLIGDDFLEEDCDWYIAKKGERRCGLRKIPDWVKNGGRSPTGRHTFTTWRHWTRDDKPLPSGLLGPVTLRICYTIDKE